MYYRTMKHNKLFILSVCINFLIISALIVGGGYYRDRLIKKVYHVLGMNYYTPSEKVLKTFNNEPLEAVNDSFIVGTNDFITMLFLGNSLTYTEVPEEESDKTKRGLTSTNKENDYVHRLVRRIAETDSISVKYSIVNIAEFERTFVQHGFDISKLSNVQFKEPDYLIVQIGENVGSVDIKDNPGKYESELESLINLFPNSKKIITLPFWPYKEVNYLTTKVAIKTGTLIVDLSHLGNGNDEMCFASSQRKYKTDGVGEHPGDYGMEKIAQSMYAGFNILHH